jgi:histidyl-tRNA synthetase
MSCISPYPRGAPEGLPFQWEAETLRAGLNFTLITKLGAIDLFGEITGGGTYETLIRHSEKATLLGVSFSYLNLEKLIEVKRAAGRLKDFEVLAELEAIQEERE